MLETNILLNIYFQPRIFHTHFPIGFKFDQYKLITTLIQFLNISHNIYENFFVVFFCQSRSTSKYKPINPLILINSAVLLLMKPHKTTLHRS